MRSECVLLILVPKLPIQPMKSLTSQHASFRFREVNAFNRYQYPSIISRCVCSIISPLLEISPPNPNHVSLSPPPIPRRPAQMRTPHAPGRLSLPVPPLHPRCPEPYPTPNIRPGLCLPVRSPRSLHHLRLPRRLSALLFHWHERSPARE